MLHQNKRISLVKGQIYSSRGQIISILLRETLFINHFPTKTHKLFLSRFSRDLVILDLKLTISPEKTGKKCKKTTSEVFLRGLPVCEK
jgi:hypothetical protein